MKIFKGSEVIFKIGLNIFSITYDSRQATPILNYCTNIFQECKMFGKYIYNPIKYFSFLIIGPHPLLMPRSSQ